LAIARKPPIVLCEVRKLVIAKLCGQMRRQLDKQLLMVGQKLRVVAGLYN
jgi:hypothetical protein